MRTLPASLAAHVQEEVTTLCRCWIIEAGNGETLGFTDHDNDLTVDSVLCEAASGMEAGNIEANLGLKVEGHEVVGAIQSDRISKESIRAGKFDQAKISTWVVNWQDPASALLEDVHYVSEIDREDGFFKLELRTRLAELEKIRGRHFNRQCPVELGGEPCGVDLSESQFHASGNVIHADTEVILSVSGLGGFEAGWFSSGRLTWTTGQNAGRTTEIATHLVSLEEVSLHLWAPQPFAPIAGDQFDITAGCDKLFETCKAKFSNGINFRGFPHIPGNDRALAHASTSEHLDGGPLVP